jgi:hypothetical protein
MPQLLQSLLRRCNGEAAAFVSVLLESLDRLGTKSFQELWQYALFSTPLCGDSDALRAMEELGGVLGRYDLDVQLDAAVSCLEILRFRCEKLRQELPKTRQLTFGLSLSASMLLGIILI